MIAAILAAALALTTADTTAVVVKRWPTDEARQGVAVDATAFYAIDDRAIGKYDKTTGRKLAEWRAAPDEPFTHLNGCVVIGTELVCAHSNYPAVPMWSTIEVFDTATLRHVRRRDLGKERGSATWVDSHDGAWWVAFAHYSARGGEPGKGSEQTTLRRFDRDWREVGLWMHPPEIVARWQGMSNSGGAWHGGRLYTTGHDEPALYVFEVPPSNGVLKLVATVAVESAGQGIAFDPAADLLYSIQRATKEVLVSRLGE
jgi:hypothetical protein